jgi:hypothetical protein
MLSLGDRDSDQTTVMRRAIDFLKLAVGDHAIGQSPLGELPAIVPHVPRFRFGIEEAQDPVGVMTKQCRNGGASGDADLGNAPRFRTLRNL